MLESREALANQAAVAFKLRGRLALEQHGAFAVALSGGSTPRALFSLLASPDFCEAIPWVDTHVFWVDERCVPPDHPDSNFCEANDLLLTRVPIPAANIHRMKGELEPHSGALDYREQLAAYFGGLQTRFDLALLGLGTDGHTASLFPHTQALEVTDSACVANHVRTAPVSPWRLTLTFPAINTSRAVIFLVAGENKARAVSTMIEGNRAELPAQGVRLTDGQLVWMLDRAAASKLTRSGSTVQWFDRRSMI